jgi:hypothetical protein
MATNLIAPAPQTPAANQPTANQPGTQNHPTGQSTPAGPAPLQKLRLTPRFQDDPTSVSITFLSGRYNGEKMEVGQWLGSIVQSVSHEISAEWEETEGSGIRCSSNFKKLGPRTFSLSIEFYDPEIDIAHLAENLATLLEVDATGSNTPPLLLLRQGALVARPVFCTRITPKYSYPHGGDRGYKMASVDLSFQLMGGLASENALGKPLASVPLVDIVNSKTEQQRRRDALRKQTETLLAPCLGEKGSTELRSLIDEQKFDDPVAVGKLSPDAFVQSAIGGMIPKKTLEDPAIRKKLEADLAIVLSNKESGIGLVNGSTSRQFAESLITGNASGLTADLQSQAVQAREDYQIILSAIASGQLGDDSDVFAIPTAANRLRKLGSCGLSLKQVGKVAASPSGANDDETLKAINELIADKSTTDKQIKERFGLKTESQSKLLRNSAPFESKDQFLKDAARLRDGLSAIALWNRFQSSKADSSSSPAASN